MKAAAHPYYCSSWQIQRYLGQQDSFQPSYLIPITRPYLYEIIQSSLILSPHPVAVSSTVNGELCKEALSFVRREQFHWMAFCSSMPGEAENILPIPLPLCHVLFYSVISLLFLNEKGQAFT